MDDGLRVVVSKREADELETAGVHNIIHVEEAHNLRVGGQRAAVAVRARAQLLRLRKHLQREALLVIREPRKELSRLLLGDPADR